MKYLVAIFVFASILFLANCEDSKPPGSSLADLKKQQEIYLGKGKQIANSTFVTLSTNLQKAMKEGGVSNAVKYCNIAASPLVDSLSKNHNAVIRRTSLKFRNSNNKPNSLELAQLQSYENQVKAGEKLQPIVKEIDAHTIGFYAPIHVMPLCQKCHGKVGETLLEEDYKTIQQYYPNDKAVGYKSGDLRGMWSITFKK